MKIKNISIENFQSYYETQALEFGDGLNLIIGNGGKGKSKLFNAFYWVLFGKIYITGIGWCLTDTLPGSAKFSMKKHDFFNKKALRDAEMGKTIQTSVRIELEDDKGNDFEIERSSFAKRTKAMDWQKEEAWEVSASMLKVSFDSPNGTVVHNDIYATDTIKKLFPEGIRNYIWFQGESLENLINLRNKDTLKAAVKHISYFPFYEKMFEIITKSKSKIERQESVKIREANKHNTNVKELISTIEKCRLYIENEEKKRQQIENNIDLIKMSVHDDETKLTGLVGFSGLVSKYKNCEIEIINLNNEINTLDKYQREYLPKLWILRGINEMVAKSKQIIEAHKEEEDTVPERKYLDNPSRSKLEEIIKDKQCFVCGSPVIDGNDAYTWIVNRLQEQDTYLKELDEYTNNMQFSKQFNMFVGKIQDYPDNLLISLASIDKCWKDSEDKIEKYMVLRRKKNEDKRELDKKIEDAKKKFGVDPVQQAGTADLVQGGIKASRLNLEREQKKLDVSKQTIANYKASLRVAEKELEKIGKKDGGAVSVPETEWKNISFFLEDICKRVQENARKDLIRKIEKRANQFYKKFTEHDKGYKGNVKIDDDYSIEFDAGLNTSHEDRKKMSIINALLALNQEAIGTYYPFISDAPTSSFDIMTTHNYLLGIKDIFGQSIIMTKDVDLNSEQYQNLVNQSNVSKIYILNSKLYCDDSKEPELYEVSTIVESLKRSI